MKVLFVNVVKDLAVQKAHYPLGFGYLVSYCRKQGAYCSDYHSGTTAKCRFRRICKVTVC